MTPSRLDDDAGSGLRLLQAVERSDEGMGASPEACAYGNLVREIRAGRSQRELAAALGLSRSYVAAVENGRLPSLRFHRAIAGFAPHYEDDLTDAFRAADLLRPVGARAAVVSPDQMVLRRIARLRDRGRFEEAQEALQAFIGTADDPAAVVEAWEHAAQTQFILGRDQEGIEAFVMGIAVADQAGLLGEASGLRDLAAGRLMRLERFADALDLIDAGLRQAPKNAMLWRRRGHVNWYAGNFASAYADLNTALGFGIPKARIFHARGQVLAEWGYFKDAIKELTVAIEDRYTPRSVAYARSTRAYAYGQLGQRRHALNEFALAEQDAPNNAWLFHFRARCYDLWGEVQLAGKEFARALGAQAPRLNPHKQYYAVQRLSAIEAECS